MKVKDLIESLRSKNIFQIRIDNDFQFMKEIKPKIETDTHFVGNISLFHLENELIVKERDDKGNYYYRIVDYEKYREKLLVNIKNNSLLS
jgi:hypothetical protein